MQKEHILENMGPDRSRLLETGLGEMCKMLTGFNWLTRTGNILISWITINYREWQNYADQICLKILPYEEIKDSDMNKSRITHIRGKKIGFIVKYDNFIGHTHKNIKKNLTL